MKVAGRHSFEVPRERVWDALHDPQLLAAALPGARRLEPAGDDRYELTVDVGVGAVKGAYDGTFALSDQRSPEACTVRASATGGPGSVEVVARMRLTDTTDGALLDYEADATVTGPLAGIGQRLIGAAARRSTEQFLAALEREITAPTAVEAPGPAVVPHAEPRAADTRLIVAAALAGAAAALVGVAVGRWTARR